MSLPTAEPNRRHARLDALRGIAMVWMAAFHFGFDLNHFGFIRQDFYRDPFWTWQRTMIVTLFLFCAGLGQAVALAQDQPWRRFWTRWAQIAGGALLVTAGSLWMFPRSFIFFGVLHAIALMLIISRLTAPAGRWLWVGGLLAIALPWFVGAPLFDGRLLSWTGLYAHKPVTEDFVPLLPWLGVMWWGLAAGQWLLRRRPHWLSGPLPRRGRPLWNGLALLGGWSLSFYLLHQPVLIGLLSAASALR